MPSAILIIVAAVFLYAWATSMSSGTLTERIAQAIALAEGFFHPSGTAVPQRANNPGDLKLGDLGLGTIGGKTIYATADEGWAALQHQIDLMLSGRSAFYSPDMTILQVAETYTGHDNAQAWANTVAQQLGVTPDTPIGEIS